MRARLLHLLLIASLAGPTALAFASGGYFDDARLVALLVAWGLAALALALGAPLPAGRPAWVALGAIAGLTGWVALSAGWAPLAATARGDLERDVLYAGALLAAMLLLTGDRAARLLEPILAAGTVVVLGYGLAGRLVPGLVTLTATQSAGGRLEQPLTYWNATGALAGLGLVLCVRLAGAPSRGVALRAAAAAGAVPLATALLLSFSRGALAATAVGVLMVLVLAPRAATLRGAGCALVPGLAGAFAATRSDAVRALRGDLATREAQGALVLALLLVLAAIAAGAVLAVARRPEPASRELLPRPRVAGAAMLVVALVALPALTAAAGGGERPAEPAFGATTSRLATVSSNRAGYWRVAWRAAREHPLRGVGSGGFGPAWLRERRFDEPAKDAHSLELETLAELGAVGLVLLVALLGAVAAAARDGLRRRPEACVGPAAVLAAWLVHATVDWDWEMPALTLVAVACAGALLSATAADPRRAG